MMRIHVTRKNQATVIRLATQIMESGGTVVYPTDTAYALGGIYNRRATVKKILLIKNRRDEKFTVIAGSRKQAEKFFTLNVLQKKLARKHWPGPLSLVVSKQFAVRVPKNDFACRLAMAAGAPLIATSANLSGTGPAYTVTRLVRQFMNKKNQPQLICDAGALKKQKPSTVVKVVRGKAVVLRAGPVKLAQSKHSQS